MMDWHRQATELFASAGAWIEGAAGRGPQKGWPWRRRGAGSLAARQVVMARLAWKDHSAWLVRPQRRSACGYA